MNILVRRYKRDNDKAALYIFANSHGEEVAYVYAERINGKDRIETMDSNLAANTLTHKLGLGGFLPDGSEEIIDMWALDVSDDAPTGGLTDFRTAPEVWSDDDFSEGELPPTH